MESLETKEGDTSSEGKDRRSISRLNRIVVVPSGSNGFLFMVMALRWPDALVFDPVDDKDGS